MKYKNHSHPSTQKCTSTLKNHKHIHGPNCGHKTIQHGDHVDYIHDGHYHRVHGNHVDLCEGPSVKK